jgi:hypothetical protein
MSHITGMSSDDTDERNRRYGDTNVTRRDAPHIPAPARVHAPTPSPRDPYTLVAEDLHTLVAVDPDRTTPPLRCPLTTTEYFRRIRNEAFHAVRNRSSPLAEVISRPERIDTLCVGIGCGRPPKELSALCERCGISAQVNVLLRQWNEAHERGSSVTTLPGVIMPDTAEYESDVQWHVRRMRLSACIVRRVDISELSRRELAWAAADNASVATVEYDSPDEFTRALEHQWLLGEAENDRVATDVYLRRLTSIHERIDPSDFQTSPRPLLPSWAGVASPYLGPFHALPIGALLAIVDEGAYQTGVPATYEHDSVPTYAPVTVLWNEFGMQSPNRQQWLMREMNARDRPTRATGLLRYVTQHRRAMWIFCWRQRDYERGEFRPEWLVRTLAHFMPFLSVRC